MFSMPMQSWRWIVTLVLLSGACTRDPVGNAESGNHDETSTAGEAEHTNADDPTGTSTTSTTADTSATQGETSATNETSGTDAGTDTGVIGEGCDLWAEHDCPEGYKCMPYGTEWDRTKCTPLDPNPKAVGEACAVVGTATSGIDDCGNRAMCWNVDANGMGECIAFCIGTPEEPSCADPMSQCRLSASGVLIPCLPTCNPLDPDCPEGQVCVPNQDAFICVIDATGPGEGYGSTCEYLNVCDPGLLCLTPEHVPGCESQIGCCSAFCDLTQPNTCPGADEGQSCIPYFESEPPMVYENVGVCGVPSPRT